MESRTGSSDTGGEKATVGADSRSRPEDRQWGKERCWHHRESGRREGRVSCALTGAAGAGLCRGPQDHPGVCHLPGRLTGLGVVVLTAVIDHRERTQPSSAKRQAPRRAGSGLRTPDTSFHETFPSGVTRPQEQRLQGRPHAKTCFLPSPPSGRPAWQLQQRLTRLRARSPGIPSLLTRSSWRMSSSEACFHFGTMVFVTLDCCAECSLVRERGPQDPLRGTLKRGRSLPASGGT